MNAVSPIIMIVVVLAVVVNARRKKMRSGAMIAERTCHTPARDVPVKIAQL
jgi:hypothetical protein